MHRLGAVTSLLLLRRQGGRLAVPTSATLATAARHSSSSSSSSSSSEGTRKDTAPVSDAEVLSSPKQNNEEAVATQHVSSEGSPRQSGDARTSPSPSPGESASVGSDTSLPAAAEGEASGKGGDTLTTPEPEPVRWVQLAYEDPDTVPIVDAQGEYLVSKVQWPTGEIAYATPPPVDDKLAPRFGYNVVQVKKHVSWWQYNQKYPRLSLAYINIQVLFLLGLAWLAAFLTTEHRRTTEAMKTPGALVGEHRGRGPVTSKTQKVTFTSDEMSAMVDKAQNNWLDGSAEANYVGSKEYRMKKIPRPKEFSVDDFRKR